MTVPLIRTGVALAVLFTIAVAAAAAGEVRHLVREGDSASAIAKAYYGDAEQADLLLRFNDKPGPLIHAGETLRVPYCEIHRIRSGDTWSALAQRYVGRASAYPAIARLNGRAADEPLRLGDEIVMPVIIEHRLARGESLALLAERAYGDPELAVVLRELNGFEDPRRLSIGTTVRIPFVSLHRVEPGPFEPPEIVAAPEPAPAKRLSPRLAGDLAQARRAYAAGDYADSRAIVDAIRDAIEAEGADAERAELWRLLTFLHVAFDEPDAACAAYEPFRDLAPDATFDPDLVSPKILRAIDACSSGRPVFREEVDDDPVRDS